MHYFTKRLKTSFFSNLFCYGLLAVVVGLIGCAPSHKNNDEKNKTMHSSSGLDLRQESSALIPYDYKKGEITTLCDQSLERLTDAIKDIIATPEGQKSFDTINLRFENLLADFSQDTSPLTFMGYVSTNAELRKEAASCEEKLGKRFVEIFTNKDLYLVLKAQKARNASERRLYKETIKSFEENGLKLSEEKLNKVRELKSKLTSLETKFSENLNNDTTTVTFTRDELKGTNQSFLDRLKKTSDGKYIVTTKSTDYVQVMENAENPETRRRMMFAYNNRAGEENTKLLNEAIQLRRQIASLMGYATWADYRTESRMAKNAKSVSTFLNGLRERLAERNKSDLALLLKMKQETYPQATSLDAWDINYYTYQLKKRDYSLDDELIREYFPADHVMKTMFEIYSTILGVEYEQDTEADVWAKDVRLYKVKDAKTKEVLAYFFADMVPREGKYGHAAAFTLISGRHAAGGYNKPISSIVSNFNPPANGRPSLLSHSEVETLFHEFGHIMHQVLTRAPYASLSGTSVSRDFVEAPSQMLENWVWDEALLKRLSRKWDTQESLPDDLIKKMLEAKDFNQGYFYTRQLLFGLFDYTIHTSTENLDVNQVFDRLHIDIVGVKPIEGGRFPASFGHMMGGYDAGYYGYLWSEVYAQDMFSIFEKHGLLSSRVGAKYRRYILESGNMKDSLSLVTKFLGRKPNSEAFYKKLGISSR